MPPNPADVSKGGSTCCTSPGISGQKSLEGTTCPDYCCPVLVHHKEGSPLLLLSRVQGVALHDFHPMPPQLCIPLPLAALEPPAYSPLQPPSTWTMGAILEEAAHFRST